MTAPPTTSLRLHRPISCLVLFAVACTREPAPATPPAPAQVASVAPVASSASVNVVSPKEPAPEAAEPDIEEDKEVPASAAGAFRLALVERDASWSNPPAFQPCAWRDGTTVLCGLGRVTIARADRVDFAESMEAGLPRAANGKDLDGTIARVAGRFPDDAWLVLRVKGGCNDCSFAAYRWERDAWSEKARFEDESFASEIGAWRGSLFGLLRHGLDKYELRQLGGVTRSPPSVPELACTSLAIGPSSLAASGRTMFVAGNRCGHGATGVMRSTVGAPKAFYDDVDGAPTGLRRGWARGDRAAFYGSAHPAGALVRFDGKQWTKSTLPPRAANVFAYDQVGNVEWLLTEQEGDTKKGQTRQLWTRTGAEPWRAQNAWKSAVPARYGLLTEIVALTVAGGTAWLAVNVESKQGCVGIQGCPQRTLVLRTGTVAKAQDLPL